MGDNERLCAVEPGLQLNDPLLKWGLNLGQLDQQASTSLYTRAPKILCYLEVNILSHSYRETPKRVIGKQCRPRLDTTQCGI